MAYRPAPPYPQEAWDAEPDGNAGFCPTFSPNQYNRDECFRDGDAGLIMPEPYTIVGPLGSESVVPCSGNSGTALGETCQVAAWGADVDIFVDNSLMASPGVMYMNVLMDWNQDGSWGGSSNCPSSSAPEHVLVDFEVPGGYVGALSGLGPPPFAIGPNSGYVWARFSITERAVGAGWNGSGQFDGGETEDYLLRIDPAGLAWDIADRVGGDGTATTYIELASGDGRVELAIDKGASVLTGEGSPLQSVDAVEVPEGSWPEPPAGAFIVAAFDFGPDGATFSPAMTITIEYDPARIPEGVAENELVIASFNSETGEWEYLPVSLNAENNTLTAEVGHFTVFAVLHPPSPSATPEEGGAFAWAIAGPLIAVVAIGGVVYYVVRRRRSASASEESA